MTIPKKGATKTSTDTYAESLNSIWSKLNQDKSQNGQAPQQPTAKVENDMFQPGWKLSCSDTGCQATEEHEDADGSSNQPPPSVPTL